MVTKMGNPPSVGHAAADAVLFFFCVPGKRASRKTLRKRKRNVFGKTQVRQKAFGRLLEPRSAPIRPSAFGFKTAGTSGAARIFASRAITLRSSAYLVVFGRTHRVYRTGKSILLRSSVSTTSFHVRYELPLADYPLRRLTTMSAYTLKILNVPNFGVYVYSNTVVTVNVSLFHIKRIS